MEERRKRDRNRREGKGMEKSREDGKREIGRGGGRMQTGRM